MMQTTQKDIIFKIIDSLMKYMDKQALLQGPDNLRASEPCEACEPSENINF